MSTYAIGDLQGCFLTLQALLAKIKFDANTDRLWFVGDLVNRGAGSFECLRFVKSLGDRAVVVLGNHDLHLLAIAEGVAKTKALDTLDEVLNAPDRDALLDWLRRQKLLHVEGKFAMVHAGLLPQWNWSQSRALAGEVEEMLRGKHYRHFLESMYGNNPDKWRDDLEGDERLRVILNAMTRMRAITADGRMNLKFKSGLAEMPKDLQPWFTLPHRRDGDVAVLAGHWSALGLHVTPNFIGLDSGCVWGRELTAIRLEDRAIFQVPSQEIAAGGGE
jgi:bis(5'-nucleosyl)-tetraphosphatase (symmetrical)